MMIRHPDVNTVHSLCDSLSRPVVLVPTMGALHAGHRELLKMGRHLAGDDGKLVATIFVNPIQFDRAEDLENYPVTMDEDLAMCEEEGVDVVFTPEKEDLYAADHTVLVKEDSLSQRLCGATRPGHFDGVLTVVLKLFALTGATHAVFGEKDYQQLALIRRMVRDLNLPVSIKSCPTVRESDGLALSSRNLLLTKTQRQDAPRIQEALQLAQAAFLKGETDAASLLDLARDHLEKGIIDGIDYLELVDAENLQPVKKIERDTLMATACFYGEVRLIDNVVLTPDP